MTYCDARDNLISSVQVHDDLKFDIIFYMISALVGMLRAFVFLGVLASLTQLEAYGDGGSSFPKGLRSRNVHNSKPQLFEQKPGCVNPLF